MCFYCISVFYNCLKVQHFFHCLEVWFVFLSLILSTGVKIEMNPMNVHTDTNLCWSQFKTCYCTILHYYLVFKKEIKKNIIHDQWPSDCVPHLSWTACLFVVICVIGGHFYMSIKYVIMNSCCTHDVMNWGLMKMFLFFVVDKSWNEIYEVRKLRNLHLSLIS